MSFPARSETPKNQQIGGRMYYFAMLGPEQQRIALRKLAASGMARSSIAAASGLSVEQVAEVLAIGGLGTDPSA